MSDAELSVDEVTLPIKRTEGETLADRLTDNAYQNILPARYLRKDADGELVEGQEDLFERVAKNIALAEAVYEARNQDVEITVTPDQLKPDHPRRDELAEEVFGKGTSLSDDAETTLSVYNVNKFAYETVVPELPADVREHVEETATAFQDLMEDLSFMPNCVPPASRVAAQGGLKPLGDIEPGERVYDDQDGTARVDSKFENGEKLVTEIETESGYTVQATPEHYFRVISASGEYEWRQVKDLQPDDVIALQKNFLDDEGTTASLLPPMAADGGTVAAETTDFGRPRGDIDMPASMTPALAEWLGLYVGDGTARESGVRVAFDEQDDDLVEYWGELTESVFGFEPTTRHRNDAACVVGQAGRRDLYDHLDQNDLLKDASKTAAVPDAVLESGRTCIETFLSGLFEADGTVGERAIELYTHSELLADQVQKLLLGLGIRSSVSEKRDGYRVTIRKNVCGKRFVERVGFLSERKQTDAKRFENVAENATSIEIPNQTDRLHEWFQQSDLGHDAYRDLSQFLIDPDSEHHQEIGVGIFRRYAEKYPELWNSPVAEFVERDQFYERVSTVDDVGRMAVEDMQVPRRNTYVVEGFVSHNSPTLMNAGDELQQLSACFVDSPEDDIDDIHQTAKEAAQVFQCLTDDTNVYVEGKGVVSIADVEPGDRIVQRNGDDHQVRNVDETHAYDDSPVNRVETEAGVELTGTPNHKLLVDGDWTRIDEIEPGDTLSLRLDWIDDVDATTELTTVAGGAQWVENRTVSNDDILELYADGHSDYEIADRLDSSASTIQRRRSLELGLDPNGSGGRPGGNVSFDESEFEALYDGGHSDGEIAKELGVSTRSVARYRQNNSLDANGEAVKVVDQPTELTPALAELVGMWVGDGSKHEDGIRFHLNREETLEHADRLARDLFDVGLDWRWDEGCYEAVVHSHEVKRWWLANFGDAKPDATSASVPESVQQADRETIGAFLRGLYSTDGSLQKDVYPRLWSSSAELIDDVQQLLLGLGVPAIKWEYDTEDRDYFNVGPTGGQGLEQFQDLIGFVDSRSETMAETLASIDSEGPSVGTRDGSTWHVPVEAVEDAGTATVYDVTVADNHEYVASSVVSHNSGGGMGYAFWRLRPYGDAVGSTGGIASGPITFMRTYDQMCETIAQGGARRGAQMGVMRVSHPDVIQFIHAKNKDVSLARTLRLNDPDDFTHNSFADALEEARELIDDEGRVPEHLRNAVEGHLSNFNISVGITDDFMEALQNDEEFTFTNPRTGDPHIVTEETKELYDMFGLGEYVEVGEELSIPAAELWDDIVEGAHENGEPGVIYLERANKEHSFDVEEHPDHRILATNPCVTGDTLISTDNGLVPAEDLYEQGVAQDVVVDGRLSEDSVKEASSVFKTGEKDVYELTTEEGYELRLTADHRMMTDDGWVEAQNLEPGDTVHVQNRKGEFGQHGSVEEGRVLGWLVGDGHLKHGEERAVLNFYDEDTTISERFADDVNEIVREPFGNADYEVGVSDISRGDDYRGAQALEQRIRSARLYEYAEETGLAEEKLQVPDAVMRGSEEMARGFLRALFSADGSVQGNVEKGVSVRLASVDADFLKEVQQLLLNFGIASKVYEDRKEPGTVELPDGTGDTAEYETEGFHELVVVKDNLVRFGEEVGFLLDTKDVALDERLAEYDRGPYSESFEATVESVEYDGHEAVYDLTEPDTHSFVANGLVCHNCGEQPLEEYEACNLGHINLSTLAAGDAPDWRVWSTRHAEEYENFEAAVEAYLEEAIDVEELEYRIETATRFLENVVTMSDFPVEKIEEKVRNMRKIGLGIMGLAQLFIQLGVKYGSDEGDAIAGQLMQKINHDSKWASHELAEERGVFNDWEDSKYADPTEYREWFEHYVGEDADDFEDGFAIRNHNTTTIAPTGTTSMVGNTTGGCEPVYNVAYYKNVSDDVQGDEMLVEFDDYFLRVLEENGIDVDAVKQEAQEQMAANEFDGVEGLSTVPDAIGELFVTTGDLSPNQHASIQCTLQDGVDSAISKCLEEGTLVQTDSGVRPIESFVDEDPEPGEFTDVDEDVTIDGVQVESQYYAGEKDATRVRVDNGTEIVGATDSHKVLTPSGWTVLGDLQPGDHVVGRHVESHGEGGASIDAGPVCDVAFDGGTATVVGNSSRSPHEKDVTLPDRMSPRLAKFLGMYAADGSAIDSRYGIEISTASKAVRDEARELFEELFDREPTVEEDTRRGDERKTVYGVQLNSKPVWEFVTELCGSGAYEKRVPRTVLRGGPDEKLAFVNGVTLDGYVSSQSLVVYGGMSERLADGVAELLRSFGVPKVYVGTKWVKESSAYAYQVHVTNEAQELVTPIEQHKRVDRFDQRYRVYVSPDRVDKTEFNSRSPEYYAARNFEYRGRNYMFNTTAEQLGITDAPPLYEVTDVEDAGTREMYDIELAGPHEYVVGGLVSHNTVNAPNDSTIEDAKDVFEYIYEHGGKGVTYYRDGTRSKQVLTTRADNTDFADMDVEEVIAQIEAVFGGIEAFLEDDDVQAVVDDEIEALVELADGDYEEFAKKRPRPDVLHGVTQRIDTGYGKLYVNINEDPEAERPFELFANIGNSGGFTASFTEALAKTISTAMRAGVDPGEIADELQGIRSPKVAWDKGEQIQSIPDAIGTAMRRYLDGDIERAYPQQQTLEETADEDRETAEAEMRSTDSDTTAAPSEPTEPTGDQQELIENGESPECPECGSMSLYYSEGCKTCESCGWSEC
ncbi:Ribonucleoside-diphosphate reductase protein [Halorhabdus tiamatea SARL4B]|uniref:Ribonucleoside-diphosphate reductase n=1 Tax=Halorhabdus tiamatea SARL4B TaxID=1033806 RepID=F7PQI9_9EURY|nr:intein-containing adenosylcobalamin-dependent ribonucleoside-diphosphate reductase [Halorhabdus tiamatea]ERJ04876.1 Ribonucleoside-diphosphate reductase protein [Halorhabdus tiamatea SARL4B]CCQ33317.1 ribonucleoside-diphosphate reductase [Halorhabdus tiamatea SARL4B]